MRTLLLVLALGLSVPTAFAEETIHRYDLDIAIEASGALDVTENITVTVEGNQIRRGIYRDFPTHYRDRYGNRVVVDLQVLGVERNGNPEPWFTEQRDNGVRINTGDDNFLPAPAEHTFTIHYRTTRQLGFFADHDELYWNAIGTGWIFPIAAATIEARLPSAVPTAQMSVEGYTGVQGAKGQAYEATLPQDGVGRWQLTAPLNPREGLTIVMTFPKGIITQPTGAKRASWFFKDNGGVLIALIGWIVLLAFCFYEWRRVGRDPAKGIIIARYEPPEGQSPSSLRYLRRRSYDTRCFSAAVLQLAVSRCVRVVKERKLLKDEWRLERDTGTAPADTGASTLLGLLFKSGSPLVLKNKNAATVQSAMSGHNRVLSRSMKPRYFRLNGWSIAKAVVIAVPAFLIALIVADQTAGGAGVGAIMALAFLALLTLISFGVLVSAPTIEGRKLLDEIEGLKLYLSVAERDELARMTGPDAPPQLDAKRYETLLPYAVALEVEEAWTRKFTLAVGAAAAAAAASNIGWYHGGSVGDLGSLTEAVGSSLTSQIASSSSPPGSSSGAGGGGSSGGGGGGGGGGGR